MRWVEPPAHESEERPDTFSAPCYGREVVRLAGREVACTCMLWSTRSESARRRRTRVRIFVRGREDAAHKTRRS